MKKKPFLLLELLISIFLIILCAIPLIIKPIQMYQEEFRLCWEIEGERLADWTFSEIKEKFLKNEIAWEKLPDKKKKTQSYSLQDTVASIGGMERKLHRKFTLTCKREHEGVKGELYRMFEVRIDFSPPLTKQKPLYRLMACKENGSEKKTSSSS